MATDPCSSEARCTAWGHYNMATHQCDKEAGHDGLHHGGSYVGDFSENNATYKRPRTPEARPHEAECKLCGRTVHVTRLSTG